MFLQVFEESYIWAGTNENTNASQNSSSMTLAQSNHCTTHTDLLGILCASKSIHAEASEVLMDNATFHFKIRLQGPHLFRKLEIDTCRKLKNVLMTLRVTRKLSAHEAMSREPWMQAITWKNRQLSLRALFPTKPDGKTFHILFVSNFLGLFLRFWIVT